MMALQGPSSRRMEPAEPSSDDDVQRELDHQRFKCRSLTDQLRRARDSDSQCSELEQVLEARLHELRERRSELRCVMERTSEQFAYHEARAEELALEVEHSRPSSSHVLTAGEPQHDFLKKLPLASRAAFSLAPKPRSAPATAERLTGSQPAGENFFVAKTLPGRLSDLLDSRADAPFPGGPPTIVTSEGCPVALAHARADSGWVAALQCLRHAPGFVAAVAARRPQGPQMAMPRRGGTFVEGGILESLVQLFHAMTSEQPTSEALRMFRFELQRCLPDWRGGCKAAAEGAGRIAHPGGGGGSSPASDPQVRAGAANQWLRQRYGACQALSPPSRDGAGSGGSSETGGASGSFAPPERQQAQQRRPFEFLQQMLQYLDGALADPVAAAAAAAAASVAAASLQTAAADAGGAEAEAYKVLFDYSVGQWAASSARLRSAILGDIFEGQWLTSVHCQNCGRYGATASEPFTLQELSLSAWAEEAWLNQPPGHPRQNVAGFTCRVHLEDLLRKECEGPAPAGYCCPEPLCRQQDTSIRITKYLRMPSVLVLHVNRVCADGTICQAALDFEDVIDLHGWVAVFGGSPLDRNLQPCTARYELFGAVFHRSLGSAQDQHFAFVRSLVRGGEWCCFGDDSLEPHVRSKASSPKTFEAAGAADAARVSLLFYARSDAIGAAATSLGSVGPSSAGGGGGAGVREGAAAGSAGGVAASNSSAANASSGGAMRR